MSRIVTTKGWGNLRTTTYGDLKSSGCTWNDLRLSGSTVNDGIPLYETYYDTALQFKHFVDSCDSKVLVSDGLVLTCVVPRVVNMAFCCELLLKSICTYKGATESELKKHSLDALLRRADLDGAFQKHLQNPDDFSEKMEQVDEAFKNWRYEAEGPSLELDLDFLMELQVFLEKRVQELRAEKRWREAISRYV